MAEDEKTLQDFVKGIVSKISEGQASQALQKQADLVASTIGGHVSEVLGPVQEGVDVIKNTFTNTIDFMQGTLNDISGFFGLDEMVEEKIYRGASLDQGADIIEESKIGNSLTIKSQELTVDMHNQSMRAMNEQMAMAEDLSTTMHIGWQEMAGYLEKGNDIAEDDLKMKHEERLEEMRGIEKKDKTIWDRVKELFFGILLGPFAIIAGLIAGFAISFGKVLLAPLKVLRGVFAVFVPAIKEIFSFKGVARWIARSKFLTIVTKPFRMIQSVFTFLGKNKYLMGLFKMSRWIGAKILFPLFVIIDAFKGLSKVKEIFGPGAGMKEKIIAAISGIVSGLLQLPAKAFDWTMQKVLGIETDLARYFDIETIAKLIDGVGNFFKDNLIAPVKNWLDDPKTEAHFKQLGEDWDKASKAIKEWADRHAKFFKDIYEKYGFGTKESRAAQLAIHEKKSELERQVEIAGAGSEVGVAGVGDQIRMSKEDQLKWKTRREEFTEGFGKWFEKNFGDKDWGAQQAEQTDYLKSIAESLTGQPLGTTVSNISTAVGGAGGATAVGGAGEPREEPPVASLITSNKVRMGK